MKRSPTFHTWFVLALALFSFGMSAYISRTVFERLPHLEDELAYLYQARIFARGQVVVESPQPTTAFWQPFLLDRNGNRFSKYPPAWSAQLAVGEAMGAAWWVNAALSALAVALVYRLGAALFDRDTGALAALLLAFSPMALLLNGTLMGHTSALVFALLFLYACWRMERGGGLRWGIVAGAALGMVVANRPLAGVGVALPVAAWWVGRVIRFTLTPNPSPSGRGASRVHFSTVPSMIFLSRKRNNVSDPSLTAFLPLALRERGLGGEGFIVTIGALIITTLLLTASLPLYNYLTTGDATTNLYTFVWSYDRLGFGECCGRSGHTLAKALNHLRYDLSLAAADVHGWQLGDFPNAVIQHLRTESVYYPNIGLSWLIIIPALVAAFGRGVWRVAAWLLIGLAWVIVALNLAPQAFASPQTAWLWIGVALAWALAPLVWLGARGANKTGWAYLLLALVLSTLIIHMTYWIGSQRYSARYYYEALGAWMLLGALPLAWLARRVGRLWLYGSVLALMLFSLFTYSLPRLRALYGFNNVGQRWIEAARARAESDQPLLVIVTGTDLSWRAMGTFMAVTSPYLDSEIIAIYNRVGSMEDDGLRDEMVARFPDRQVIDLRGQVAEVQFVESD